MLRRAPHEFVNNNRWLQGFRQDGRRCRVAALDPVPSVPTMNPRPPAATKIHTPERIPQMLRAFLLFAVMLAASPALAAGDIDTCRDAAADPVVRLAACETVIADDKITGEGRELPRSGFAATA